MKKIVAFVLILVLTLSFGMQVAAADACTHPKTEQYNPKVYEYRNATEHTVYQYSGKHCLVCDLYFVEQIVTAWVESHNWINDYCVKCGAIVIHPQMTCFG